MLLEVRDLKTYFFTAAGTVRAVDGELHVRAGETVALVGSRAVAESVVLSVMRLVAARPGACRQPDPLGSRTCWHWTSPCDGCGGGSWP